LGVVIAAQHATTKGATVLRVLILGGTGEARRLAERLSDLPQLQVVSSLAGRVARPLLPPGEVRIGGFGGVAGLAEWLRVHEISAVVDATHPFAVQMSDSAVVACARVGVPLRGLRRLGWQAQDGDVWHRVPSLVVAAEVLPRLGRRVFLTTGRKELAPFAGLDELWFLIRTVDAPEPPLPARCEVLLARGPFAVSDEVSLMRQHQIDVLVTKDSGGEATAAKLVAARELGIPVVMVDRPGAPGVASVASIDDVIAWLLGL
jgi:precorrin-6A/cobalt-precorrin-6A reductase